MNPTFSICIPIYNMAGFLPEAVDSALGQTCTDLEVLIVDNASTDRSYEIAGEYARRDRRVRVFRNTTNIGHLGNFNRCFELAKGTWLKFLCADDWIAADCLERLKAAVRPGPLVMNCAEEFAFPPGASEELRQIHLRYWRKHCLRLSERFPGQPVISADEFAELVAEDPTTHSMTANSATFHRSGWERFGRYKLDLLTLNDWELAARIGVQAGVINVEGAVCYYRIHGSSLGDELVSKRPFATDVLYPLMLRHEVLYQPDYTAVREAAERQHLDLRYELFDAVRHARDNLAIYTKRGDTRAADDWNDLLKRYPRLASIPPTFYPKKIWRYAMRRLRPASVDERVPADAGRSN